MKITNITIIGKVERAGDCATGTPTVTIVEENGSTVVLGVSKKEAKIFAQHLYETVYINFDAKVKFYKK
jgi:hypothetical protein